MYILVKEIDGENIIVGTARKKVVAGNNVDTTVYEIPDEEYSSDMIHSRLDSFDEE